MKLIIKSIFCVVLISCLFLNFNVSAKTINTPVINLKAGVKKVSISYKTIDIAKTYEIYMRKGVTGKWKLIRNTKLVSYTKKNLKAKMYYYFKVRAVSESGKKSKYSEIKRIKTKGTVKSKNLKKIVYITGNGAKYHLKTCRCIKKNKLKLTAGEARALGYTACGLCDAPK